MINDALTFHPPINPKISFLQNQMIWQSILSDAPLVRSHESFKLPYHNFSHTMSVVMAMKNKLPPTPDSISDDSRWALYAGWFHDIHYFPGINNEEYAAQFAWDSLTLFEPNEGLKFIKQMILATKTHTIPLVKFRNKKRQEIFELYTQFLLEADLQILSASPQEYDVYAKAIEWEYTVAANVPTGVYLRGRLAWIKSMLERSDIVTYTHDAQTFVNLEREFKGIEDQIQSLKKCKI